MKDKLFFFLIYISTLNLAQTYIQLGNGNTWTGIAPMNYYWQYGWTAMLYDKSEINAAGYNQSGLIKEIQFKVRNNNNALAANQKIYLCETTVNRLTENKPSTDSMTLVFEGQIDWRDSGWVSITFNKSFFNFTNTMNLLVYLEDWAGISFSPKPTFDATYFSLPKVSALHDHNFPESNRTGYLFNNRPDIKFNFLENANMIYIASRCFLSQELLYMYPAGNLNRLISLRINVGGQANPFNLSSVTFSFAGETNLDLAYIKRARLYYTDTVAFNDQNLLGEITSLSQQITFSGLTRQLKDGYNYFWLAVEIDTNAPIGAIVDAACESFVLTDSNLNRIPTYSNPSGYALTVNSGAILSYGTRNDHLPIDFWWNYGWSGLLYRKEDLNLQRDDDELILTDLYFYVTNANSINYSNQKIYVSMTNLQEAPNTKPNPDTMTLFYEGAIDWQTPGWKRIRFNRSPLIYNKNSNLFIYYENWAGVSNGNKPAFRVHELSINISCNKYQENRFPLPEDGINRLNIRPNTIILFEKKSDMRYIGSVVSKANRNEYIGIYPLRDIPLIKIQVSTFGTNNPINLNKVKLNLSGTTNYADIKRAKLYYTVNSVFNLSELLGEISQIGEEVEITTSKPLRGGQNYLWFAVEIDTNVLDNNKIKIQDVSIYLSDSAQARLPQNNIAWNEWIIKNAALLSKVGNGSEKKSNGVYFFDYSYGWSMFMVKKEELYEIVDTQSRRISSIGFEIKSNPNFTATNCKVYVGHWKATQLPSSRPNPDTLFLLYEGAITLNKSGWFEVPFSISFNYNGKDNLLFYFERRNGNTKTGINYGVHPNNPGMAEYFGNSDYVFNNRMNWGYRPDFFLSLKNPDEMAYASSIVENVGEEYQSTKRNTQNVKTSRLKILVDGNKNPFSVDTLAISFSGTSNLSDIKNVRVYYTHYPIFSTANLFGESQNINNMVYIIGRKTLTQGSNYFWITVDIDTAAADENLVNVSCEYFVTSDYNLRRIPSIKDPQGALKLVRPLGGKYLIKSGEKFQTLTKAITYLNISGIYTNVELELHKSEYSSAAGESFPLRLIKVNEKNSPYRITITNADGITSSIKTNQNSGIILEGVSNFEIKAKTQGGIKITSPNNYSDLVIIKAINKDTVCENILIENCEFNGYYKDGSTAIKIIGWESNESGGGHKNIIIKNNLFRKIKHSIVSLNPNKKYKNTNLQIKQNIFGDDDQNNSVGSQPIILKNCVNVAIENNVIKNLSNWGGAIIGLKLDMSRNVTIIANKIYKLNEMHPAGAEGVCGIEAISDTTDANILIANNIIDKLESEFSGCYIYGIRLTKSGDSYGGVRIINNTVILNKKYNDYVISALKSAALFIDAGGSNLKVKNNIFINALDNVSLSGRYKSAAIYSLSAKEAFVEINRNIYYSEGRLNSIGYLNGYAETIEEWRLKTQNDTHSLSGSVSINQEYKPLMNSLAYQTGQKDLEATTDYYGQTRADNCAIGAVESYYTTTAKPDNVEAIYPINNQLGVSNEIELRWKAAQNALGYRLYFGTNNPPSNIINNVDLSSRVKSGNLGELEENRTYYWKVVAYNNNGESENPAIYVFTTGSKYDELPRFENFDLTTAPHFPVGWIYAVGWGLTTDGAKVYSAPNALEGYEYNNANNQIVMGGIKLKKDIEYEIEFMYKTQNKAYLEAKLGFSSNNFNQTIFTMNGLTAAKWKKYTSIFSVLNDSVYYLQFKMLSGQDNGQIYIDNIKIRVKPDYKYSGILYANDMNKVELGQSGFYVQFTTANTSNIKYTIEKIKQRPRGGLPFGLTNIAEMYWEIIIDSGSVNGVFNVEIDFDRAQVPGVLQINKINLLKRENANYSWNDLGLPNQTQGRIAKWTGLNSFSEFAIASDASNPLPVELESFVAKVAGRDVELKIKFGNNSIFTNCIIERIKEGEKQWKIVSTINYEELRQREYYGIDRRLTSGIYTYRLKVIDFEGTYYLQKVAKVEIETPKIYALEQNYPNPFNPTTIIEYSLPEEAFVKIDLYDAAGRLIKTLYEGNSQSGYYKIELNATELDLKSGVYFYRLITNKNGKTTYVKTLKMALIK